MLQVEFNKKSVNPYYGMSNTLEIFQNGSKGVSLSKSKMQAAWSEAKTMEQKAILLSVLFSIGDVTGRQHNIFEGKVNSGGNSQREVFRDTVIPFLVAVTKEGLSKSQRLNLIKLVVEYTTMDNIVAAFMATIVLSKNPDADARDLIGLFSSACRMFNGVSSYNTSANSLLRKNVVTTAKQPLIDSEDTFVRNLKKMKSFLDSQSTSNGTNISSIPENLNKWAAGDSNKIEELQRYPVWTLISDGNFNNLGGASSSLNDFMRKCEIYFGFKPFLILIDVAGSTSANITQFSGIDNVMMIPPNPANIEMFLTNFKDMDTYDVYTPLLSLSRSDRYAPVRNFVEANY